jgi:hypothetical protein
LQLTIHASCLDTFFFRLSGGSNRKMRFLPQLVGVEFSARSLSVVSRLIEKNAKSGKNAKTFAG